MPWSRLARKAVNWTTSVSLHTRRTRGDSRGARFRAGVIVTNVICAVTDENFPSRTVSAETPAQRAFGLRSLSGGPATVQP